MLAKKHYFIQLRKIYYPIAESIYIPLCFYFIGKKPDYRTTVKTIYIPLCFYFILIRCSQRRQTTLFTFHYASTLSSCRCYKEFWIRIYIPLCFYFIPFIVLDSEKLITIYIPLCFYFIGCPYIFVVSIHPHLHSTMLLLYPDWPAQRSCL